MREDQDPVTNLSVTDVSYRQDGSNQNTWHIEARVKLDGTEPVEGVEVRLDALLTEGAQTDNDLDRAEQSYRIERARVGDQVGLIVYAGSERGAMYGIYEIIERLGLEVQQLDASGPYPGGIRPVQ